ncbi:MAG TPA: dihydrolipoamide acetyltransferase family protein [Candidatus Limnocylindria bacterium]|nr:dihydrolipoamide acetyltransferase family protein [Candidatus Limnocylindria bacterium]
MSVFELKMPKLGESVTEGTIGKWLKQPGEKVNKYDLLVEVQTDKVNTEIPSPVAGTLKEVKVDEGQTVPIGTLLATFDTADGEAAAATPAASQAAAAPAQAPAPQAESRPQPTPPQAKDSPAPARAPSSAPMSQAQPPSSASPASAPPAAPRAPAPPSAAASAPSSMSSSSQPAASSSGSATATAERPDLSEVRATPAVRKLAAEHGIDISQIEGTGLGGRVSKKDVEDYIASAQAAPAAPTAAERPQPQQQPEQQAQQQAQQPQAARPAGASQVVAGGGPIAARPAPATSLAGDELVPLSQMRRAIANNMVQAWSAPHAHAVMEIDMTELMRYREKVRGDFQAREGFDLSPAAFICKAAVEALRTVPLVNSSFTDQGVIAHKEINLGYAVALGDEGLVVPVIRDADGKSLAGLMRSIRDVVDRAKARRLTFDDFYGGTFTVNNTGPLGTIVSSPIVPPGQAAIVSSETIVKRLVVTDDDAIAIRQRMNLVIGFDHRVIDGATAARFLQTMRDWLQTVGPTVPVY